MNTRVSWIDPEQLQSLIARISPPQQEPEIADSPAAQTVSDEAARDLHDFFSPAPAEVREPVPAASEPPVVSTSPQKVPVAPSTPEAPIAELAPVETAPSLPTVTTSAFTLSDALNAPSSGDTPPSAGTLENEGLPLDRIRERLRSIRHRAVEAGILSHQVPAPPLNNPATAEGEASPPSSSSEEVTPQAETATTEVTVVEEEKKETIPLPIQPPAPESKPITVTQDIPFEVKIEAFAQQITGLLPVNTWLLILDGDGGILWSNDPRPGLVLSTLMAMRSAVHSSTAFMSAPQAVTYHELPPDQILSVLNIPATSRGPLQIAVKGALPLAQDAAVAWLSVLGTF